MLRGGYAESFFPIPQSASNLLGQQVPYTISQNYSVETNPLDYSPAVPPISNPFPPIVPVKPRTTAELNAANPRVLGHVVLQRHSLHADLAGQLRAAAHGHPHGRGRVRGEQG